MLDTDTVMTITTEVTDTPMTTAAMDTLMITAATDIAMVMDTATHIRDERSCHKGKYFVIIL